MWCGWGVVCGCGCGLGVVCRCVVWVRDGLWVCGMGEGWFVGVWCQYGLLGSSDLQIKPVQRRDNRLS